MISKKIASSIWAVAIAATAMASPVSAQSGADTAATAPDSANTVIVPVFGTSMVVTIITDPGGGFISADLSPASPPAPVAGSTSPDGQMGILEIRFDSGASTAEISIRLDDGTAIVAAGDADVVRTAGDSQWVGDPLGNGDIVVVGYTVGTDAAGAPTIEINSINGTVPAGTEVVTSAGDITWYQILAPTVRPNRLVQFITFFDAPADASTQVSTNLTFDITTAGGQNNVSVSLTDPNAASTIDGTATPRGERDDDDDDDEREGERDD